MKSVSCTSFSYTNIQQNTRKAYNLTIKLNRGSPFCFLVLFCIVKVGDWAIIFYAILLLCVELTSSAHQTSNICCLCNTFSCVATLSELNSSQKFRILQIVLSEGRNWQWILVSLIEILLPVKEHQVPFTGCHTTDHFICIFLPSHDLKKPLSPLAAGLQLTCVTQTFPQCISPVIFESKWFFCTMDI